MGLTDSLDLGSCEGFWLWVNTLFRPTLSEVVACAGGMAGRLRRMAVGTGQRCMGPARIVSESVPVIRLVRSRKTMGVTSCLSYG